MPPWLLFGFPLGMVMAIDHLSRRGWTDVAIVRVVGAGLLIEVSVVLLSLL